MFNTYSKYVSHDVDCSEFLVPTKLERSKESATFIQGMQDSPIGKS